MKIISLNVNGIRASERKGLYPWLKQENADIICLQEIRADMSVLEKPNFQLEGYHSYFEPAQRKGYSGVAIYSKKKPHSITTDINLDWAKQEGRYLQADFDTFSVVSLYLPSGSHNEERQQQKFQFMEHYSKLLKDQLSGKEQKEKKEQKKQRNWIICGDWNIAHTKDDIKNWRSNQKNSGFLPEERAWMDDLFNTWGYSDAFRVLNHATDQYTWWSNRGKAYANNVGWRIDYQVISSHLASKVKSVAIYKAQRFSDHAPLIIEYSL